MNVWNPSAHPAGEMSSTAEGNVTECIESVARSSAPQIAPPPASSSSSSTAAGLPFSSPNPSSRKRRHPHLGIIKRVRHPKLVPADFDRKCAVCGNKALNYNYGVICCESCKMFFRRNSWKSGILRCSQGRPGECNINFTERRDCSACRLKKCLDCGMLRELNSFEWRQRERNPGRPSSVGDSGVRPETNPLLRKKCSSSPCNLAGCCSTSRQSPSSPTSKLSVQSSPLPASSHCMEPPFRTTRLLAPISEGSCISEPRPLLSASTTSSEQCRGITLRRAMFSMANSLISQVHSESSNSANIYTSTSSSSSLALTQHLQHSSSGFPPPPPLTSSISAFHPVGTSHSHGNTGGYDLSRLSIAENRKTIVPSVNGAFTPVKPSSSSSSATLVSTALDEEVMRSFVIQPELSAVLPQTDVYARSLYQLTESLVLLTPVGAVGEPRWNVAPLTRSELQMLGEMEFAVLERILKQPMSTAVARITKSPTFELFHVVQSHVSHRVVHYCKSIPAFQEMPFEKQSVLMLSRLSPMIYGMSLVNFDQISGKVAFPVEDNSVAEYRGDFLHHMLGYRYTITYKHVDHLQALAKVLGPCRRNQALYLAMKLFEVLPQHEKSLGPELAAECLQLFTMYATLMMKALYTELQDEHRFEERWRAFCHLYVWARHEFDMKSAENVRRMYEQQLGAHQLLDEIASTVKSHLANL